MRVRRIVAQAALVMVVFPLHAQPSAPLQAAAAVPRFDVLEFVVEGNTVLQQQLIERVVYPYMGEARTADDVEAARAALEALYRQQGFGTVVVDTPEQRVVDGVIRLQVLEAPVSRLRVVGAKYFSQGRILEQVPGLAEGQVPNFKQVSEQLSAVNRSADRVVTPLLRPGKTPGTTEVDLRVEDKLPLHGSVEINNRQSANTTPTRLQGSVRYDNLWQRDHSLGLQVQVAPQKPAESAVLSASYSVPSGKNLWVVSALVSDSNVVAGVGDTTVLGKGQVASLRHVSVLDGDDKLFHTATLGVDFKNFKESVSVGASTSDPGGFSTPIRYLPLSASYAATLNDDTGRWQAGAGLVFALRGVLSEEQKFEDKRYKAQSNFALLKFDLSREHKLPWGLTAFGKLTGQITGQPLIGNEQFVAGGVDTVRGYLEAAAVGDRALQGSFEVRSPPLLSGRWPWLSQLQVHTFIDGARLLLNEPLPEQKAGFTLLGAGFGLKVQMKPQGALSLQLGWPLHDAGTTKKGDLRVHAQGSIEF